MKSNSKKKEPDEMGKVWADIEVINAVDEDIVKRGILAPKEVRRVNVHALVDTGATMLMLHKKDILELGLNLTRTTKSRIGDGKIVERKIYGPVKIRFVQRTMLTEAVEIDDKVPPLLGQIPLEGLDVLIDPKGQCLYANPASGRPDMALIDVPSTAGFDP